MAAKDRLTAARPTGSAFPQAHLAPRPAKSPSVLLALRPTTLPASAFSDASLSTLRKSLAPGDVVEVRENKRLAAYGLWTGSSKDRTEAVVHPFEHCSPNITEPLVIDDKFWRFRLFRALDARRALIPSHATDTFRLADDAGDGLPGVTVDVFGKTAVIRAKQAFATRLAQVCAEFVAQEVTKTGGAIFVSLPDACGTSMVSSTWEAHCTENGVNLPVRLDAPYLMPDLHHRALRAHLKDLAPDRNVLIVGDNLGAFAAHALVAQAKSITLLEPRGPAFVDASRDVSARLAHGSLSRRVDVFPTTLEAYLPQGDIAAQHNASNHNLIVLVEPYPGRDVERTSCVVAKPDALPAEGVVAASGSPLATSQDWLKDLGHVETLCQGQERCVVLLAGRRGTDVLGHVRAFCTSKASTRQWRLLKRFSAAVDFPSLGLADAPIPAFSGIFEVARRS